MPLPGSLTVQRFESCLRVPIIYEGLHEVCPLCRGASHQLQACPQLPIAQKVEVLVEKFDASGVPVAQPLNDPSLFPHPLDDSWVTVSPKKRVKSMLPVRTKRNSVLNPRRENVAQQNVQPSSSINLQGPNPPPLGPNDIILANPLVMNSDKGLAPEDWMLSRLGQMMM